MWLLTIRRILLPSYPTASYGRPSLTCQKDSELTASKLALLPRHSKDRKRERRRDRPERDRSDRPERSERPERGDRDRTDRGDRSERPDDVAGGDEAPREKRRRSRSRDRAKRKRSRSRSREHKRRERRSDRNGAERGPDGIKTEPTDQDGFGDRDSRTENYDSAGAGDFGGGGYNSESQGSYPKIERGEEYN